MNRKLFSSRNNLQRRTPATDTRNNAGGVAYSLSNQAALAQYAVTGTFQDTFYVGAKDHLKKVEQLAQGCPSDFIAKLAVYSRQHGRMKDMPAYLLAVLASRNETAIVKKVFPLVCNNSKVLFAFTRIIRSGAVGRTSFGTAIKRLIQDWITGRHPKSLYLASVGHSDPSMADVIKMVHPRPQTDEQSAMFKYLLGRDCDTSLLPADIQTFEQLKRGQTAEIPDIPFRALTNCDLSTAQWKQIALNMPWNTLRQNLNMLARRGVYDDRGLVRNLAVKLADEEEVVANNAFPFELLATWKATKGQVPIELTNAIQEALEVSTRNVPSLPGDTLVAVDVSGSMCGSPVTGNGGKPSIVTVVECAALIACSILRNNKTAMLVGFDSAGSGRWHRRSRASVTLMDGLYGMEHLNPFDSVMTNVEKMNFNGGGTDCSLPFRFLLHKRQHVDNIIILSDYESWAAPARWGSGNAAATCNAWKEYSRKHRNTKLACVDLQPQDTNQVPDDSGRVVNIGGFSDTIWKPIGDFFARDANTNFVEIIESTEI
jgi:60 kDa SS-A/Ro ribonucleoprotein